MIGCFTWLADGWPRRAVRDLIIGRNPRKWSPPTKSHRIITSLWRSECSLHNHRHLYPIRENVRVARQRRWAAVSTNATAWAASRSTPPKGDAAVWRSTVERDRTRAVRLYKFVGCACSAAVLILLCLSGHSFLGTLRAAGGPSASAALRAQGRANRFRAFAALTGKTFAPETFPLSRCRPFHSFLPERHKTTVGLTAAA